MPPPRRTITMIRAGIPLFHDEKAPIFEPSGLAAVPKPSGAVFYCPHEVKDIGLEANKIRSSRVAGILFDNERIYLTYNTGSAVMKWETRAELRLLSLVEARFCRNPARPWYSDENVIGLMLGDSMDAALQLLDSRGGYKRSHYRPDAAFPRFWFCPNIPEGELQLRILTSPAYGQLCRLLLSDLGTGTTAVSMEHDALDAEGPGRCCWLSISICRGSGDSAVRWNCSATPAGSSASISRRLYCRPIWAAWRMSSRSASKKP